MSGYTVRRGHPTPEELGIVISVLSASRQLQVDPLRDAHQPLRHWAAPTQFHRPVQLPRGRGSWILAGRHR